MSSGLDKLNWQARAGPAAPPASRLRDPARLLATLGALTMMVGCLMPWATGVDGRNQRVAFGANDGTADGVFIIVAAIFVLIMTLDRGVAETRSRTLQLGPSVASVIAALIWVGGLRSSGFAIEAWIDSGGSGGHAIGLWLTITGIVVAAIGTGWIHLRRSPEIRVETVSLREEWDLTRRGVSEAIAGMVGAGVGAAVGLAIAVAVAGSLGVLLMVILCAAGFVFGMQLAVLLVRRVGSGPEGH
jgi:hypothetical protein